MAAKKVTRESKINFIKKNLKVFKARSKADENKFDNFEQQNDEKLDILYKVIQGCVRRKQQREAVATTTDAEPQSNTPKEKKNKRNKKNDIFKKFGLDKGADLVTLQSYHKDAQALLDAVTSRIKANKETKKAELEKSIAKMQKELAEIG